MKHDLVTTLTLLKVSMGGELPPLTPLTKRALKFFDPKFLPGMGVLAANPEKGLRCPLRGCGEWRRHLGHHIKKHRRSPAWLRRETGLGPRQPLATPEVREAIALRMRNLLQSEPHRVAHLAGIGPKPGSAAARRNGRANHMNAVSVSHRNLRDRCDAQLRAKLLDLAHTLGRSPSTADVAERFGKTFVRHLQILGGGSFNATKARLGFVTNKPGFEPQYTLDSVLPSLSEWYRTHGALPSSDDANRPNRLPLIPTRWAILRALDSKSWPEAMHRVAALLDIHGGRYGLPPKKAAA